MNNIGLLSSSCQHLSNTSWHLLSISGFSLCTEAKSKSVSPSPEERDEADPPPKPINIAGPPKTTNLEPMGTSDLLTCSLFIFPSPPASIIGLW